MFSLFIFHPFFQGVSWPHLPLCTDAHDSVCFCRSFDVSGMRTEGGAKIARFRAPPRSNCSAHSGVIVLWRGRCQHCLGARASSTAQQRVTSSAGTRDVMTAHVPLTSLLLASLLRYADSHYLLTGKCLHHCSIRYDTIRDALKSTTSVYAKRMPKKIFLVIRTTVSCLKGINAWKFQWNMWKFITYINLEAIKQYSASCYFEAASVTLTLF